MAERQIRIRVNRDPDGHVLTANSGGHRVRPAQNYRASHNARRNYDRYLALAQAELKIRRVPMLEPHEEYMLAKRWREHDDLEGGAQARQQSSAPRHQDRHGLSRLRRAHLGIDLGGQCPPDSGGPTPRAPKRGSAPEPCPLVGPSCASRI